MGCFGGSATWRIDNNHIWNTLSSGSFETQKCRALYFLGVYLHLGQTNSISHGVFDWWELELDIFVNEVEEQQRECETEAQIWEVKRDKR